MKETFPLGRIAGIRVGAHWSVLVIVLLVTLTLARGLLPAAHPGHSAGAYWGLGLAASVMFMAGLLVHEAAHAAVARRNGVEVEGITLWVLGGVARLSSEARTPGAELRIAGAGPLASGVLGGLVAALALWLDRLSAPALAIDALDWVAAMNLLLAAFNAFPATPLDGGRLLHAFLWWRTGDRLEATATTAAAGRAFGWLLALFGFIGVMLGAGLSGLWLVLIGWFLVTAATAEGQQAKLRSVLTGVAVRQVMTPDPITAPASLSVEDLLRGSPFGRFHHSVLPVTDSAGAALGLVSVRQINRVPLEDRPRTTLRDIMCPLAETVTVSFEEPADDLMPRLQTSRERHALVLDPASGKLVGVVAPSDIRRAVTWLTAATEGGTAVPGGEGRRQKGRRYKVRR